MSTIMVEPQRPQKIRRMHVACWISTATRAQAHARARAPTPIPCTRTQARKRKCVILIAFPRQEWLRERASVLRYMYKVVQI